MVLIVISFLWDKPIWDDWLLDSGSVQTLAQPTSVDDTDSSVDGRSVYEIALEFTDQGGQPRASRVFVNDPDVIKKARQMIPIAIEYDPDRPTRCRVRGQPASVTGALILLPLASVLMGLAALIPAVVSLRRTFRLYRWGKATQATVTRITATGASEGDNEEDTVMRATYVFNSQQGRTEGFLKRVSPPSVGTVIWIIYDPQQPSRNVAVPEKIIYANPSE